jgi:hypothetical protein
LKFRAADGLVRAGLAVSQIRSVLPRVDPERIWVRAAPVWFRAFWAKGISALAMPWGIYVHPAILSGPSRSLGSLLVHELAHIEQWRRLGAAGWARSYLGDYLRSRRSGLAHQDSYLKIGLEAEARGVARAIAGA